jgi:hypothetical protein
VLCVCECVSVCVCVCVVSIVKCIEGRVCIVFMNTVLTVQCVRVPLSSIIMHSPWRDHTVVTMLVLLLATQTPPFAIT